MMTRKRKTLVLAVLCAVVVLDLVGFFLFLRLVQHRPLEVAITFPVMVVAVAGIPSVIAAKARRRKAAESRAGD